MRAENPNVLKDEQMPHTRTTMSFKLQCLAKQGYDKDFQVNDEGLMCLNTGDVFQPGDIFIVEHDRFEGITNPEDMAILYVIETNNGLKGTVIDAFGIYANPDLNNFMKKVEDRTTGNIDQACECGAD